MLFEVVVKVQVYCGVARRGRSAAFACVRSAAAGEIDLLGARFHCSRHSAAVKGNCLINCLCNSSTLARGVNADGLLRQPVNFLS